MKIFQSIKNSPRALAKAIKYYFYWAPKRFIYFKYYKLYELVAYRLIAITTVMVRQLIIRMGKNPDYIAPPAPAPHVPTIEEVVGDNLKSRPRPNINIPYVPSWVRASFKSLANHPTYQSRVNLNLQPNYLPKISEPLQVALAPEPTPEPVLEVVTEILSEPSKADISVDDTGEITYGFIKYGDDNES